MIPFLDMKSVYAELKPELDAAYARVMESGWFVLGKEVEAFEAEYAAFCGTRHCVGLANGLEALELVLRAWDLGAGDEVIVPSNTYIATWLAVTAVGARVVPVEPTPGGPNIDPDRIEAAITPRTRAIAINSPSNPTGWTATKEDLAAILALARERRLWIVADEIYALYYYQGVRAPSFLDVMEAEDRILFVNSFSKNWSMTGWRAGWIVAPAEIGQVLENLIQYSTSGVAQFIQAGAVAALDQGDGFVAENVAKATTARDLLCDALIATNRVETLKPDGAIYTFLKIDGVADARKACFDIVDRTGVGLAPGTAFGEGGSLFMRACFLRDPGHVAEAAERLARYIAAR